jgi:hypothetical protein
MRSCVMGHSVHFCRAHDFRRGALALVTRRKLPLKSRGPALTGRCLYFTLQYASQAEFTQTHTKPRITGMPRLHIIRQAIDI